MGLKKSDENQEQSEFEEFDSLRDYINYFYNNGDNFEAQHYALSKFLNFEEGAEELIEILKDTHQPREVQSFIGVLLEKIDPKDAPIEDILDLLKIEDAFIRNLAINIVQNLGEEIRYYIVKFLFSSDRDLRIFAVNILGDVNFEEARDMMIELIEKEQDINVAMTAVDYLAEIGQEDDIPTLEELKERFNHEDYVVFGVDRTISMIRG